MDLFIAMQFNAVFHWLMHELTFAQARALFILAARKELTVSQLAKFLRVGNPTASILVQQLVERGVVTRTEHPTDRRHTILRLTPKAEEIAAGRRQEREKQWQRWLSDVSIDELNDIARGLSALTNVVKKEMEVLTQNVLDAEPVPVDTSQ
jgi:DNA-binding MarR family transcriptional regulator